ncbi:hypothetical protein DH2020_044622 [Rehmannia glutinosa]|uniref:Arginase n=1 Tax=Rehmannia glutinosa TaxID=99300 RepID=A0ABR0UHZ5_REHGL
MNYIGKRGIHFMKRLNAANVPTEVLEEGQRRVIDASLKLIGERVNLKAGILRSIGGATATPCLIGLPLGHNSSYLEGPVYAPPRIREAMWDPSTNSTTELGSDISDPRVLSDVGDVPVQELREAGIDDHKLMGVITDSIKLLMDGLGGPVDILHIDAHPDLYDAFEGNKYSHASSFARIMEGGYARRLLQQLGEGVKGVYISVDVDCLDPAYAPGVSHLEPGGLSFRDVLNIIHNLRGNIVGADVVEFNPQRDPIDGLTAMVAAKFVREIASKMARIIRG